MGLYRNFRKLFVFAVLNILWSPGIACAAGPTGHGSLTPLNTNWDGLSTVLQRIRSRGFCVSIPSKTSPTEFSPDSIVFAIEPGCLRPGPTRSFVQRGGGLVVADETGKLDVLWTSLGMVLHPSSKRGAALLSARVYRRHPVTSSLPRLWTNRPGTIGCRGLFKAMIQGDGISKRMGENDHV